MSGQPIELTRGMTLVLIVLCKGSGHGYAIMLEIKRMTEDECYVSAGTLYRSISQILTHGLIEEAATVLYPSKNKDLRRRYYQITERGPQAIEAELKRIEKLIQAARSVL